MLRNIFPSQLDWMRSKFRVIPWFHCTFKLTTTIQYKARPSNVCNFTADFYCYILINAEILQRGRRALVGPYPFTNEHLLLYIDMHNTSVKK